MCNVNDSNATHHSELFVVAFSDREYPRLGQMIVDYENPLKKMMEEFVPHSKVSNYFSQACSNLNWEKQR